MVSVPEAPALSEVVPGLGYQALPKRPTSVCACQCLIAPPHLSQVNLEVLSVHVSDKAERMAISGQTMDLGLFQEVREV